MQSDQGLGLDGQPAPPPAEPAAPAADTPQGTTPVADDQGTADLQALLEALPPEAREYVSQREKMMQADYTRKTQELAEQRKAVESDLEFLQTIRTDPYAALEFHKELTDALIQSGLTPAQAAAEATATIEEAGEPGVVDPDDALRADLEDLKAWKAEQEETARLQQVEAELTRQEMAIRQSNPSYKDEDIDAIYELAFAHGGNLVSAQERYEQFRNQFVTAYTEQKAVAAQQGEPVVGGGSQIPQKFESIEDAHAAAQEALRNFLAAQ